MTSRHQQTGPSPLPSREELAAFIASAPGKVGKREIARAFNLGSSDRIWLKDALRALEDDGVLARRGKRLRANSALPSVTVAEITGRDRDGELIAEPTEWDPEAGAKPKIVIMPGRRLPPGMRAAGIGDRILVRVDPRAGDGGAHPGRIVKVLPKERTDVLGVFRALASGGGRILSVEKKAQGREVMVAEADQNGARD
ncbi:MAG: rnr, partial [Enterovirga sp.]|nr:rnr [Enterovirga sp.]